MRNLPIRLLALAALLLVGGGLAAHAQTGGGYDLTWWTVDGGGKTGVSGGAYTLLSTAGQPDAEGAVSGGQFTLLSGFWPGEGGLAPVQGGVFLPIIMLGPSSPSLLPDLVGSFGLSPNQASYISSTLVLVTAVVTNTGKVAADPFWVDFYINPSQTPAVNRRWDALCGLSPCYGLAWYVSSGLGPGQSVTLTSADPSSDYSLWPGHFAPGTTDLYLYVDSWNPTVSTGGVLESNEANNLSERHGLTVTGLGVGEAGLPPQGEAAHSPADLPSRPAP